MTKAQQMLATAGFPDTKAGRAAFHKQYPTPESFFKVYGNINGNILKPVNSDYMLEGISTDMPETEGNEDREMYSAGSTIHIDPSKRGTFTAAATKHGKSVQAFASQVLANKENYSPAMVKKANFARNAASWKHEDGGKVMYGPGGSIGISSVTTNNTIQNGDNYTSRFETGIADTEGFRQFYKQDIPGSYVHYAGSPNHEQLNVNGAYINDPFMQNFLYQRAGNKAANGYKNGGPIMYGVGSMISGPPDEDAIYNARISGTHYDRFPKTDSGFGFRGPSSYAYYMDRLKNRNVKTANPNTGIKDAIINTNTITGSCESGTCYEFADGGTVDALQLMGMPTPRMFDFGGHITHYVPSYNFGHVQSANNTYRHGFANGGYIGKYDFGSTIKDIGAGAYGVGEGFLDTITMGATDSLTDAGYKGLQKLGNSTEAEIKQQDSIHGYGQTAGAVTGAIVNPASLGTAITEGTQGLGQGISKGSSDSKLAQDIGTYLPMAGQFAGAAVGAGAFGTPGGGTAGLSQTKNFQASALGKFAGNASKTGQGFNAINSGNPMQMMQMFGQPHAMGGAVNAPNMLKYDDGGMTQQGPTQINVERGELLVNKDGKILTEYRGGGMVPHPSDGSMDPRGTVPAQEGQFVITKRLAPNYKSAMENNDRLYATAMRNNIAFDKQRKEAKEQAAQQAQQTQQEMMGEMMRAKFGGMVGQYGYGGGVIKYGGGSTIPPIDESMAGAPNYNYNYNSLGPIFGPGYNDPNADEYLGLDQLSDNPNEIPYKQDLGDTWGYTGGGNYSTSQFVPHYLSTMPSGVDKAMSAAAQDLAQKDLNLDNELKSIGPKVPMSGDPKLTLGDRWALLDKNKLLNMLPYASTIGLGAEAFLSKPFQMNAADYQIKGRIDPYEEEYRPDYRPYNAMMYSMNRNPNSDSLAGKVNLFNTAQQGYADQRYKVNQANLGRKMAAQQANLGIEGQNLSTAMNIAQFNEQNKAARRNAIREQFGKNLPAAAYNDMANQMAMAGMSAAYPTYKFPWDQNYG